MDDLIKKANKVYHENFPNVCWYGRCIFLSWYCELGTCKFCFRSTVKHKIRYSKNAKRSLPSILVEALLCKKLNWRIEFLTGGYGIFPLNELVEITRLVSKVYGEKIWLNLGAINQEDLELFRPYVKGIVASIECINPELHKKICPDKPIEPYEQMFSNAKDLLKSITIVIGLGEKKEDFQLLADFIKKHNLNRITFYALKPVKGTEFESSGGPSTEEYLWWIAQTRITFPELEIIAGTTPRRYEEVGKILDAGANAFTKFSATKMFNTMQAKTIVNDVKKTGREFKSVLTNMPEIDWDGEVKNLDIDDNLKLQVKEKLKLYLERMTQ
ncbi:radical SAM protein [Candidatus Woesearchaeota archaeon]|nr:MAG: radical SAM protein [Candidatus Woesearchaeota archaeon]